MAAPNHEILAGHRVRHYATSVNSYDCYITAALDIRDPSGLVMLFAEAPDCAGFSKRYMGRPGNSLGRRVDQALIPISVLQKLTTDLQSLD